MEAIEDPELQELPQLLSMVALRSRALSTVKKYSGAFVRWKFWATLKYGSQTCLPVKPSHVALYLTYLIQKSSTSAPIEETSNAISWAHQLAATDDPTQNDIVKQVVAGAKRILAHKTSYQKRAHYPRDSRKN